MKQQLKTVIEDLNIIAEAIKNGDDKDAIQMLEDLKEDLRLIELMA
jgi:ribosomal protein L22